MSKKLAFVAGMVLAIAGQNVAYPQQNAAPRPTASANDPDANAALAERMVQRAQGLLIANHSTGEAPAQPVFQQAAALLNGSCRLNPNEPRFWRLLAEARNKLDDVDGQITAWASYRRLLPDDRVAQARVIELYLGKIETADAKVNYLKDLLTKPSLAPELKAHIAAMAVPLLEQHSHEEAVAMMHQARQFYPLCEVLWMEYNLLPADAPQPQRVAALLDLLKANPAQPGPLFELAHFLSLAGLHEEAAPWYTQTVSVLNRMQMGTNLSLGIEFVSNLYRTGQTQIATQKAESLASQQMYPDSPEVWFLKLTLQHGTESPDQIRQARNVMDKGLATVAQQLSGASTQPSDAGTRPAGETFDLTDLVTKAKASASGAIRAGLVSALSDRAWLDLYFANDPKSAATYIDALKTLLPADDVTVLRLEGWHDLLSGNADAAKQKLTPLAEKDALSLLGLYQIEEKSGDKAKASELGGRILSEPAAGVLSAILFQAVKGKGYTPAPRPVTAEVKALLDQFPKDWITVIDPQLKGMPAAPAAKFYALRADPLRIAHHIGEPMLAKITLTNVGQQDLSIASGTLGLIQPDLWFDAQLRGVTQQSFTGLAYDRLMGRSILHPHDSISQIVRIDQGELGEILRRTPVGLLVVDADVVLNPLETSDGLHLSPGGQFVPFSRMFSRVSEPLNSDSARTKFLTAMQSASPVDRIGDLDVLAAYVMQSASAAGANAADKAQAQQYLTVIQGERSNPSAPVAAWAGVLSADLLDPSQRSRVLSEMAASGDWASRLLALAESRLLPSEARKELAGKLSESDPDADVKAFAAATLKAPELPALTQPTTAPARP